MRNFFLMCFILFLTSSKIFSQDPPIKWGEIPMADLKMTSFPEDSGASAIILCDYGESKFNDNLDIEFTRHLRIKILNENGYKHATHSIYLYEKDERLDDIEAVTYSLDEQGEIVETELDDDDIFEEEVTDTRTKINFTMPALKPGCIIDIQYEVISKSLWLIRDWIFQNDEPVRWSEYRLKYPLNISFAVIVTGYEPWAVNDHSEVTQVFNGLASSYVGKIANCHQYRWVVKNAPALRKEPYITTISDYVNKIEIQLAGYHFIQTGLQRVLQDWKTLSDELIDSKSFGDMIDVSDDVEDLTNEITSNITSPSDKMKRIYDWVAHSIVWTGEEDIFAELDADDVLEYKKGSSAEITFLLLSMLKSANINCDPVILSTRSNGRIQELYPIVSQFNYCLAKVNIGSQTYFLDATNSFRPYNILPEKVLNVKGFVIKQDKPEWVTLSSSNNDFNKSLININLKEDGSLNMQFEELSGEYTGVNLREKLSETDETEYIKEVFTGFSVDSVKINNKDSLHLPFKVQAWLNTATYSQTVADHIYLNPTFIYKINDNPFKAKDRKFPIDYGYPRSYMSIVNIHIPDGYELKEMYSNKSFNIGSFAAYKRMVQVDGKIIQIMNEMDIKHAEIKSNSYKGLKDFYSRLIQSQDEMIVLGKKESINIEEPVELNSEGK